MAAVPEVKLFGKWYVIMMMNSDGLVGVRSRENRQRDLLWAQMDS
jgi:hypothetical protein